jgi:hypothetical protein
MEKNDTSDIGFVNGLPTIRVPIELAEKYGSYLQSVIALNTQLLNEGSIQEAEQLVKISGHILAFAYSVLKAAEAIDCVNDKPA